MRHEHTNALNELTLKTSCNVVTELHERGERLAEEVKAQANERTRMEGMCPAVDAAASSSASFVPIHERSNKRALGYGGAPFPKV